MPTATAMARHAPPQAVVLHLLLQIHLVMAGSFSSNGDHTVAVAQPQVPCLHDEEAALLRFKQPFAATADSFTAFRSWKVGTDCCGWAGVHCGDADGRVTSLDLGEWGLESAGIDHALFNLTSLRYLNLGWNNFNMFQLPSVGFEHLTKLTALNLSNANFSGQIPHSIGRLTNLVSLDLSVSFEIEEIPGVGYIVHEEMGDNIGQLNFTSFLANLSSLRELHLGGVDLSQSADWCDALSMYTPNLRVLKLPFSGLSSPICGKLSALHSLSVIDLRYSFLTGPVPDFFANYSFLSVLQLSFNNLEGWIPPRIFELKKLETIDLHQNYKISGSLPNVSANSRLENLLIGDTNFSGTIPSSIGKIQSLKRLCLDAPGLSGNLPWSIGELKSLNTLKVSGLNLVGPIPSWITNLTSLEVLQFSDCGLYGPIPSSISHLIKLKTLVIMQCKASGRIPPHILNMTGLEELVLASNNFTGIVELNSLWRLPNLSLLDLSNNKIVVLEGQDNSSMVSFPNIIYLKLASCSITNFPGILKHLDDINGIDLSNNQMHGAIPRWLWDKWSTNPNYGPHSGLFFLNFSCNQFTNVGYDTLLPVYSIKLDLSFNMLEGPVPLPQYRGAQVLDYSNNKFSSMPHNFSTQLGDTYVFKASTNNLSGNIPTSFCKVFEILDLSYNSFNGSMPSCLMEDAYPLRVLSLKGNQLDGELPDNINEGCTLELLYISGNMIEGQLPKSLVACKKLEVLDVSKNEITGSFPCWMSTLPRLQVVILKHNKFFGLVTPSSTKDKISCEFPSIRILDISFNNFSGTLNKEWFSKLMSMMVKVNNEMEYDAYQKEVYQVTTELTYKGSELQFNKILRTLVFLDVSNNAFEGSIPVSIGELVFLDVLNMSHNSFTGPIPSQLGHLTLLESLDLSSNKLSGDIPLELASLDSLGTLDLSNNKLVGSIPESPHFSTFSNTSFLGNVGLCGPPLSKKCINTTTTNVASHQSKKKSVDIVLFLFVGVGSGVGFDIALVWGCGVRINKRRS